jgi:hypothetical protein
MLRRLALLLALPLAALSMSAASAKLHPVQRTIQPRVAVHYYRAKPPRRSFTQAPHHLRQAHG